MKYIQHPRVLWLLLFVFLGCFFVAHTFSYLDLDYGWHLKIGEEIVKNREVPRLESKLYTLEGVSWVDHEWLSNALIYLVHDQSGYFSLGALFSFFSLFSLLILLITAKKFYFKDKNIPFFLTAAILILAAFGIAPHSGVRVQVFTVLFLACELLLLYRFEKQPGKIIFWLPALFWLWANLHGGFLIGFFVLFCYFLLLILDKYLEVLPWLNRFRPAFVGFNTSKRSLLLVALAGIVSFLSTFFTPYGSELYAFLGTYSNTYYLFHVNEWLPAFNYPIFYHQLAYNIIVANFLILDSVEVFKRAPQRKLKLWPYVLTVGFFLLAIQSRRNFPLFVVVSLPYLLDSASWHLQLPASWYSFLKKNLLVFTYTALSLLVLIAFFASSVNQPEDPFSNPVFCQDLPCASVEFLKNNPEAADAKIFNVYGWGGYMVWAWPEKSLFIDGRLPIYPIKGHSLLEEYGEFFQEDRQEEKLSEYGIELVHLQKLYPIRFNWFEKNLLGFDEEKANSQSNRLEDYLEASDNWEKIYEDKQSIIFKKIMLSGDID